MPKKNRRLKISQWLLEVASQLHLTPEISLLFGFKPLFSVLFLPILDCWTAYLSMEIKISQWLLSMGIRKRFIVIFLIALIFGLIYGFTAYYIDDYLINYGIPFCMSVDFAGRFLVELIGYAVLIYGFFAAFLIYTVSEIPKFSNEEYSVYKKVISARMNLFAVITGFIADFLFFSIVSMYWLEDIKRKAGASAVVDFPASVVAYLAFFMLLISLLGYLVFSLVMGMLQVRDEKV